MARPTANEAWTATLDFLRRDGRLVLTLGLGTLFLAQVVNTLLGSVVPRPLMGLVALAVAFWTVVGELALVAITLAGGMSVREALSAGLRRVPWAILLYLLVGAAVVLAMAPVGMAAMKTGYTVQQLQQLGGNPEAMQQFIQSLPNSAKLYLVLFSAAILFFYVRLLFWRQALVGRDQGLFAALGDSWRATQGRFWALLGLSLLYGLVTLLVSWATTAVFGTILVLLLGRAAGVALASVVVAFVVTLLTIVWIVFLTRYWQRASSGA